MEKVAILTNFREFVPGYSLTGIVLDQVKLLERGGHSVSIFVCEDYHGRQDPPEVPRSRIRREIPAAELIDYRTRKDLTDEHKLVADKMFQFCTGPLAEYDIVLTHDLIFTGWNLPYGKGIQMAARKGKQRWLHWIHSIPSGERDFWILGEYGPKHKIVYPNATDIIRVAGQFRTETEHIRVIPHPKDLRSWFDFDDVTCWFIDDYPGVMQADIVQIYPASTDRLSSKRIKDVILVFAAMKRMGFKVMLVVANQWATGRQRKEDITQYTQIYRRNGLTSEEVCFTSAWQEGRYEQGLPKRTIRELFQCSNLFLFPTREETFGLVLPEAALAGGVLPVLNRSLEMMLEISGMHSDYIDFGSYNQQIPIFPPGWVDSVAKTILGRIRRNESIMTKTYMRKRYNWDNLYNRFYGPIFAESRDW